MNINYDDLASAYVNYRVPDPRIEAAIWRHMPLEGKVLNVGAGQGSYEPGGCDVIALEPSDEMIALRPSTKVPAIQGFAEHLPFNDNSFDASLAILTIHHWQDLQKGLSEIKRVTRGKVVILTWNGEFGDFWLPDYLPEIESTDTHLFSSIDELVSIFGGSVDVETVNIPHDCTDGFMCAYWRRPRMYLNPAARQAISTFARLGNITSGLDRLRKDVDSGQWYRTYKSLLNQTQIDCGYRLVVYDKSVA